MNPILTARAAALCVAATLLTGPAFADYVLRAPMALSGATAPSLTLSSTNVDFGSVEVTESATATVTLTNPGPADAAVDVVAPVAPFSLAHDCPASLAPAASCTLTFTFSPTAGGNATGTATAAGQGIALGGFGDVLMVASMATGGGHTMALKADGTLWATGQNGSGELGLGDTVSRTSFTQVASMGNSVVSVTVGGGHTLAVKTDGTLWVAGYNAYGQLGLGDTKNRSSFTQATSLGNSVASIAAGGHHTLVHKSDGTLWATGYNYYGQLGLGNTTQRTSFAQVTSLGTTVASVVAGGTHTLVRKADGSLWASGENSSGQLGLGNTTNRSSFTQATSLGTSVASVAAGSYHTMVRKTDGSLWAAGANGFGQLGLGDTANRSSFTQVATLGTAAASVAGGVYHTHVVTVDGALWAAGYNAYGQLGLGDTTNRSSFTQVASMGNSGASVTAGGYHTLVVKTDGTAWMSGHNGYGQLGLGDFTNRNTFTQAR